MRQVRKLHRLAVTQLRRAVGLLVCLLTATAAAQSASQSGAERQLAFRGFQIDARALSEEQFKRVLPAIKQQILVVESVGLRKVALEFLRNIPLEIDPRLHGNTGVYFANGEYGEIKLQAVAFSDKQPILLHELLHGYHFKILKVDRPEILTAYMQAKASNDYPAKYRLANFLSSPTEYFAVMASIHLFGSAERPPFDCAALAKSQREFIKFLTAEFGPGRCR